jgi:hypothetical protein
MLWHELQPGRVIRFRHTLLEIARVMHWSKTGKGGVRAIYAWDLSDPDMSEDNLLEVLGDSLTYHGWTVLRDPDPVPDVVPAPVPSTAYNVLAHIERVMAAQDRRRRVLQRADHFRLCTGCKACADYR